MNVCIFILAQYIGGGANILKGGEGVTELKLNIPLTSADLSLNIILVYSFGQEI